MKLWRKKRTSTSVKTVKKKSTVQNQPTSTERIPANRGYRKDLDCIHDSSMEANIHRWLLYMAKIHEKRGFGIMKVKYEPEIFKFGNNKDDIRYYIPDFKIITNSHIWFLEVKGFVDHKAIQKDHYFRQENPGLNLYYILPKHYELIKNYYARYVPNWE